MKTRETFGEWEGNLMIFEKARGKMNVASLVERKTRFVPARRSITFDCGLEFREWRKLKLGIGTVPWFCDPQAPRQKGSVEHLNKCAREPPRLYRRPRSKGNPPNFNGVQP